ncbi:MULTISPECIES: hypothetical protein [unclassified Sulfitobacter]|uniref:hypothetical protein n=1 Tax=unclassified Sulfitobacter TaxID=196795 RepID=UPI0023E2C26C|nr:MULTISPECIES: hypothetical protein [unclassified Sulfitobacter]MDF3384598.1 hypothetical protein [Sulfitobacter sp. Ks11]MDF3391507.1 hypothetical protein [Sulfitobacter sp. Ks16]
MKMFAAVTAATIAFTGAAFAQEPTTTQVGEPIPSGESIYEVQVTGANGAVYNCKPTVITIDGGLPARECVRAGGAGVLDQGLTGNAAAGLGAVALIALAAGGSSSTTTTTTTN